MAITREELEIVVKLRDLASQALHHLGQELGGMDKHGMRARSGIMAVTASLTEAVPASTAVAGALSGVAASIGGLAVHSVLVADRFHVLRNAFRTLVGDADEADRFFESLRRLAAQTSFSFEGVAKLSQRLLAVGYSTRQTIPLIRTLGDAVAAVGGGEETLERVVNALAQIKSKGKLASEEMLQLAEAGIPAWDALAQKLGVDIPTAMEMVERGAISADTAIAALAQGLNDRFGGAMERNADNIVILWSNVRDNLEEVFAVIGEWVEKTFHVPAGLHNLIAWLGRLRDMLANGGIDRLLTQHRRAIMLLAGAIAGALTPAIVTFSISFARAIAVMLGELSPWMALGMGVALVMHKLGVTVGDVVSVVKILATGLRGLWRVGVAAAKGLLLQFDVLWATLRQFPRLLKGLGYALIAPFRAAGDAVANLARALGAFVRGDFKTAGDLASAANPLAAWRRYWSRAADVFRDAGSRIKTELGDVAGRTREITDLMAEGFGDLATAVHGRAAEDISLAINDIQDALGDLGAQLKNAFPGATNAAREALNGLNDSGQQAVTWSEELAANLDKILTRLQRLPNTAGYYGRERPGHAPVGTPPYPIRPPSEPNPREVGGTPRNLLADWSDLAQYVQGYAAELDEATYAAARNREETRRDARMLRTLADTLLVAGRAYGNLGISLREYQQHQQEQARWLRDLAQYVQGYAAELDESAYAQARAREQADRTARMYRDFALSMRLAGIQSGNLGFTVKTRLLPALQNAREELERIVGVPLVRWLNDATVGTEAFMRRWKQAREQMRKIGYDLAVALANGMRQAIEGGRIQDVLGSLQDAILNGIGALVDAAVPGLGRLIVALGKLFISTVRWINEQFAKMTPAYWRYMRERAEKEMRKLGEGLALLSANAFARVVEHTHQFLFFVWKDISVEVDKTAKHIAQTLDSAVAGALRGGIIAALRGEKDWKQKLREGIRDAIIAGIADALLQGAVFKGLLGQWLDKLNEALAAGDFASADKYAREIAKRLPLVEDTIAKYAAMWRDALSQYGVGSQQPTNSSPTTPPNATYNPNAMTYNVPTGPILAAPNWVDQFGDYVHRFGDAVDRFARNGVRVQVNDHLGEHLRGSVLP